MFLLNFALLLHADVRKCNFRKKKFHRKIVVKTYNSNRSLTLFKVPEVEVVCYIF